MFDFLYTEHEIVKNTVEAEGERFLKNIYKIENGFYLSFFEECINSTIADAYEYFAEMHMDGNIFAKRTNTLTAEKAGRFLKLMAVHHSIMFLKTKKYSESEFAENLFTTFEMTDAEQKMFRLLYDCEKIYSGSFEGLFASALMKYVFGERKYGIGTIAFIENFCYNSFENMYNSFTRYLSPEQRAQGF